MVESLYNCTSLVYQTYWTLPAPTSAILLETLCIIDSRPSSTPPSTKKNKKKTSPEGDRREEATTRNTTLLRGIGWNSGSPGSIKFERIPSGLTKIEVLREQQAIPNTTVEIRVLINLSNWLPSLPRERRLRIQIDHCNSSEFSADIETVTTWEAANATFRYASALKYGVSLFRRVLIGPVILSCWIYQQRVHLWIPTTVTDP